ncbi:hypothetical protein Desdi_0523 [Desulfitobacterium dichloroeliminans LMG P-21439]|uniref:DUF4194 domain-containing protein n=1 Tax=Desulfitobacterium dichloroeliminans (strain LMG P-21439 / DCA1) TaxID=871963 RepID=L0F603_DESDL|nr:hypothetical protein [Desulfitobacterium dichloroeliminans]AGA68061.1 hypothetical protein Desdi_0523 [Desulfitobacterium dichloroeliminans LMG P-21439]
MDQIEGIKINPEAQKLCSMFHYGWVSKKETGPIERDLKLFRDVQTYLSLMGYELLNPPGTEWYVIRLKKEYDSASFDYFLKKVKGIDRRHMALLTIIYANLVLPKELRHVDPETELSLTVDELVYNYGAKFQQGKQNPRKTIETLLAPLKKHHYILFEKGKAKITVGPAMYMLHSDLLMDICDYVIQGLTANLSAIPKIDEEETTESEEDGND